MTNALDPGPEVRAVWTADTDARRALAHFRDHAEFDYDAWGLAVLEKTGGLYTLPDTTWLDWGCGGGAIAAAVLKYASPLRYYAVDLDNDALGAVKAIDPERVLTIRPWGTSFVIDESVDVVVSTSCFQHFPSNDYARAVLREMRRVLRPTGAGLIQARYYTPGDAYDPAALQPLGYEHAHSRFCAWQVSEFWQELVSAGFAPLHVELEPHRQYAWYSFEVAR